jgi:hypothetical protein
MLRRLLAASIILGASWVALGAAGSKQNDPVFGQINSIVKTLSEISGFAEEHPVPYGRMTKRQLRSFLSKRIKKTLRPEEMYADELSLKMFGLVPQNFNLRQSTIDLLTEQAAAFYDYDEKKLFLLEGTPVDEETTTLAHELSHALADQHFDLNRFMDTSPLNDDEDLARSAVVEGQASWLMVAYDLKQAGQPPVPTEQALQAIVDSDSSFGSDYPVLKNAPLYIQQSLLFPYSEGTRFFDSVYKKMGRRAFSAVFTDAPSDSAQIIHPERYFSHQRTTNPKLPSIADRKGTREVAEGSLGEFDHEILLRQYLGEESAKELAPRLLGGQFRIVRDGKDKDKESILLYASQWESEESARRYFLSYQKVLHRKWRTCDPSLSTATVFAGVGDNGRFVVRLSGNTVSSVEGIPDNERWEQLKAEADKEPAVAKP